MDSSKDDINISARLLVDTEHVEALRTDSEVQHSEEE